MEQFMLNDQWWLLIILGLWTLPWKGWALWKSARQNEKWWFIALLVINTVGLLEILYNFVFGKKKTVEIQK
jgi:hypothetical protein